MTIRHVFRFYRVKKKEERPVEGPRDFKDLQLRIKVWDRKFGINPTAEFYSFVQNIRKTSPRNLIYRQPLFFEPWNAKKLRLSRTD